jgi:hypothetical protein
MRHDHPEWAEGVSASDWLFQNFSDRSYPPGHLDAYLDGQRRLHARAEADFQKMCADVATDPVKLARLMNARF